MAQFILDERIRITHFVNPHVFYFKWLKDCKEIDESLVDIEKKIATISKQNASKKTNAEDIVKDKIVGFFVSEWNKWIRCVVKDKHTNGTICLWAHDYGFPFIAHHPSQILIIPNSFKGMSIKYKVHLGGMIDCIPAEQYFDVLKGSIEMKDTKKWSSAASVNLINVFKASLALEFKDVRVFTPMSKPHSFGRLMVHTANGSIQNATKGLMNLRCAKIPHDDWKNVLKNIETYHQDIWKSMDGIPLTYAPSVENIKCPSNQLQNDAVEKVLNSRIEADQDFDQDPDDCLSRIEIPDLTDADLKILDTSASRIGYNARKPQMNRPWKKTNMNSNNVSPNEFNERANRNTNQVRRNENYNPNNKNVNFQNNNNNFGNRRDVYRNHEHGYNGGTLPPNGLIPFHSMQFQCGNQFWQRNGNNADIHYRNGNDRNTRPPSFPNNNHSGRFDFKKGTKNHPNAVNRLEKINEVSFSSKESFGKQKQRIENVTENQKENVEKPNEISDGPKNNIKKNTENLNVPANDSGSGAPTIKIEQ